MESGAEDCVGLGKDHAVMLSYKNGLFESSSHKHDVNKEPQISPARVSVHRRRNATRR